MWVNFSMWKNEKFTLTNNFFVKLNQLFSNFLVKPLLSRKFFQKSMRVNLRDFHTVFLLFPHCKVSFRNLSWNQIIDRNLSIVYKVDMISRNFFVKEKYHLWMQTWAFTNQTVSWSWILIYVPLAKRFQIAIF